MKYKVTHSLLSLPKRDFRLDEIVTAKDIEEAGAGADLQHFISVGALSGLEGTETASDPPLAASGKK